jgi:protein-S-isoprenylcysteine O-methyltransferase Ste14
MLKRFAFFAYGSLSYLIFLGTFLYAICFIGNFGVPRTLDGLTTQPLGVALAIDVALLTLFAVQHSVMARKWFKDWWTRLVPQPLERSTYVLFSSLALILLFWLWQPLGGVVWSIRNPVGRLVMYGLFAFGWALVLISTFLINHFDLFGLRQVWLYFRGRPYTTLNFGTPGPYRLVRHPLYVGWLFAFWSTPTMTLAHLLFSVATSAYILLAIQFEERDLAREHGESYEAYRRSVPMLIPFTRRRSVLLTSKQPKGDSVISSP